jgi:GNAT superfamily N-acetyltransferase
MKPQYTITENQDDASPDYKFVIDRLKAFNSDGAVNPFERRNVRLYAHDEYDQVVAGLFAHVSMHAMVIEIFWVDGFWRKQGLGKKLVLQAEEIARSSGAVWSTVESTSFQARPFYEKQGYEVFAELEDSPIGHTNYWLKKRLQ